jgi:serine/threonine protein kinase
MALTVGSRLGPYEILSALGAGGMGEVYRARDTRLDRDVAIKILPDAFAGDRIASADFSARRMFVSLSIGTSRPSTAWNRTQSTGA